MFGVYGQIFSFYLLICTGIIPITLMITFGLLLLKNLRQSRSRVGTDNNTVALRERDASLLKLVLMEVAVYIICTITYPSMVVYNQVTASITASKSADRRQIESFLNFLTNSFLLYLNYNTTFYVHLATSQAFRKEVKKFTLSCATKLTKKPNNTTNQITATSNTQKKTTATTDKHSPMSWKRS